MESHRSQTVAPQSTDNTKTPSSSLLSRYQNHLAQINSDNKKSYNRSPSVKSHPNREVTRRWQQVKEPQCQLSHQQNLEKQTAQDHITKNKHQEQQQSLSTSEIHETNNFEEQIPNFEVSNNDVNGLELSAKDPSIGILKESMQGSIKQENPAVSIPVNPEDTKPVTDSNISSDIPSLHAPLLESDSNSSLAIKCQSDISSALSDHNTKSTLYNPSVSTTSLSSANSASSSVFDLSSNNTSSQLSFMLYSKGASGNSSQNLPSTENYTSAIAGSTFAMQTKSYMQHTVSSANKVPKHSISSSRLSRHLNVPVRRTSATGANSPAHISIHNTPVRSSSSASTKSSSHCKQTIKDNKNFFSQAEISTSIYEHTTKSINEYHDDDKHDDDDDDNDSLTVNVMCLPKNFHQQQHSNHLLSTISSSTLISTQTSNQSFLSSTISPPSMHGVWLDDDDDDDIDEESEDNESDEERHHKFKILKADLFKKKSSTTNNRKKKDVSMKNKTSHDNNVRSSSTNDLYKSTIIWTPPSSTKRKNSRRSFNFMSGLSSNNEDDSVLDKIKHSFSNKSDTLHLETITAGVASKSSPHIGHRTSLMNLRSKASQSTFMSDDTASIMTGSTSATASKRSSMVFGHNFGQAISSISSHSSSLKEDKYSSASVPSKSHNSSTRTKLFSLLKVNTRSSHSTNSNNANLVTASTSPYVSANSGNSNSHPSLPLSSKPSVVDKSKISSPLNFTHTVHADAPLFLPISDSEVRTVPNSNLVANKSTTASSFHTPAPHRLDKMAVEVDSRRISTPPPSSALVPVSTTASTSTSGAAAAMISSTSSSFVASPNTGAASTSFDTTSISTGSVGEYSPVSLSNKQHRLFFTQLNGMPAGSRLSFHGNESAALLEDAASGTSSQSGPVGVLPATNHKLFKRQSIDSLASLERHIGPGSANQNRYSLPPGILLSSASLRARSRLSINSTLSLDSVMSSIDRMSTPPPPMPVMQPQVLPDGMVLERVHEEGWF